LAFIFQRPAAAQRDIPEDELPFGASSFANRMPRPQPFPCCVGHVFLFETSKESKNDY
jgi:hypothetical protein